MPEREVVEAGDVVATYEETDVERVVRFERGDRVVEVAQNTRGYAMVKVRGGPAGDELERYYGLDMALDHVAELLDVHPRELPVPDAARDLGL